MHLSYYDDIEFSRNFSSIFYCEATPIQFPFIQNYYIKPSNHEESFQKKDIDCFFDKYLVLESQSLLMFQKNGNSEEEILMLKNLDIMACINKAQFKPQELPSIERAQLQLERFLVRDSQGKRLNFLCQLQQFRKYGPGVYLIFKLMKYFLIVMGILLPFPLVNILLLIKSQNHYNDTNFQTSLEATTYNGQSNYHTVVFTLNFIVILFLTLAMMYWKHIQPKLVVECSSQICLPSYFTVILKEIPNHYTEEQFKDYIEQKYGKIYYIYTAKNYHQDLKRYKLMYEVINQLKQQRQFYIQNKDRQSCIKLVEIFIKYRALHIFLNNNASDQKIYEPYCAFITFENSIQKAKLLSDHQTQTSIFACLKGNNQDNNQQNEYNSKKIRYESCEMQPDGVNWQNLNMNNRQIALRCGLITCLLLLFLFLSVTIIFIFVAAQSGLYLYQKEYQTFEEILNSNSTQLLKGYCLYLSYSKFRSKPQCEKFSSEYIHYFLLFLIFPVIITILKMLFAYIMKQLVEIRRHKNNFEKLQWQIIILSIFYFIKAGLIKFVIYRKFVIGSLSIELLSFYLPILMQIKSFFPIQPEKMHIFKSFSGQWVGHASHKIILIGIFSFNFTIFYHFLHRLIMKKYRQYKASKMLTQNKVNQLLKGQQFEIQLIYAEAISLILFCMMYFSCMPIIYILTFISLLFLYWTSKYNLIRFCKKPIVYSHGINSLFIKFIFYGLVINCIVTPVYYSELVNQTPNSLLSELVEYWQYLTLLIIIIVYLIGDNKLTNLFRNIYIKIRLKINHRYKDQTFHNRFGEIQRGKGRMQSYSMHQNEKYDKIIQILFIVNKIQINKIGYFKHAKIQQIKQEINKKEHNYQIFQEIKKHLQDQINSMKEEKSQKHEVYMQLLNEIQDHVERQVADQHNQKKIQSMIKSKIKSFNLIRNPLKDGLDIHKIIELKSKIKSQLSNDMDFEPAPQTDSRIH